MRKEASLPAPATVQSAATPSLTPLPSQRQVSHPHGLVPSLQSILLNKVIQGIIDQTYTSLDLGYDMLTELATRLQAKRLLTDENVGLFASLPELFLNNCPISDKGLRNLLEKSEMHSVRDAHVPLRREKISLGQIWAIGQAQKEGREKKICRALTNKWHSPHCAPLSAAVRPSFPIFLNYSASNHFHC